MKKLTVILIVCTLLILSTITACSSPTSTKTVDTHIYDAIISSIFYRDNDIKLFFPNTTDTLSRDGGIWVVNESGQTIKVGHAYHLVIRVTSNGWEPQYYLESAGELP